MEAVAQKFEKEDGILVEVQRKIECGEDMYLQSTLFSFPQEDLYSPYCEIKFELKPETTESSEGQFLDLDCLLHGRPMLNKGKEFNKSDETDNISLTSAASTLCSFIGTHESSSLPIDRRLDLNFVPTNDSEELPVGAYESSLSSTSYAVDQGCFCGSPIMPTSGGQYSDDSDSEIFWVKRRPSAKVEKRTPNNVVNSKVSEKQGLKRLKKLHSHSEEKHGQLSSADHYRTNKPDQHSIPRGTTPIPIKFRPHLTDSNMADNQENNTERAKLREHYIKHNFQINVGKTKEPQPIEIGPKRLKVRGPSFPIDHQQAKSSSRLLESD